MRQTIAIDGPVSAGKSTIAKALAQALGILYLDTGATYRALALKMVREGIAPQDTAQVEAALSRTEVSVEQAGRIQRTFLDGEEVSHLIRTPEISRMASKISALRPVREKMVKLQRECAARGDMVLDGRDIGTRVLPNATHKFFLVASAEVRAKRRYEELRASGKPDTFEQVLWDLTERDRQDYQREADPLRCAEDAIEIDTTFLSIEEVVARMLGYIRKS